MSVPSPETETDAQKPKPKPKPKRKSKREIERDVSAVPATTHPTSPYYYDTGVPGCLSLSSFDILSIISHQPPTLIPKSALRALLSLSISVSRSRFCPDPHDVSCLVQHNTYTDTQTPRRTYKHGPFRAHLHHPLASHKSPWAPSHPFASTNTRPPPRTCPCQYSPPVSHATRAQRKRNLPIKSILVCRFFLTRVSLRVYSTTLTCSHAFPTALSTRASPVLSHTSPSLS